MLNKKNIILTGLKACGKTSLGRYFATMTKRRFVDTDAVVIELYRKHTNIPKSVNISTYEIFKDIGERAYRAYECLAIQQALQYFSTRGGVVSTGSGTLLDQENMDFLHAHGHIYYLNLHFKTLVERWLVEVPPLVHIYRESDELHRYYHQRNHLFLNTCDTAMDINTLSIHDSAVLLKSYVDNKRLTKKPSGPSSD